MLATKGTFFMKKGTVLKKGPQNFTYALSLEAFSIVIYESPIPTNQYFLAFLSVLHIVQA